MSLPLLALTDDEVAHYAHFDDDAAAELSRRNCRFSVGYIAQIERLEHELSYSEQQREELEDEVSQHESEWQSMHAAGELIRKAMAAEDHADTEMYLQQALEELGQ
jgi:hypothetical protein